MTLVPVCIATSYAATGAGRRLLVPANKIIQAPLLEHTACNYLIIGSKL